MPGITETPVTGSDGAVLPNPVVSAAAIYFPECFKFVELLGFWDGLIYLLVFL